MRQPPPVLKQTDLGSVKCGEPSQLFLGEAEATATTRRFRPKASATP